MDDFESMYNELLNYDSDNHDIINFNSLPQYRQNDSFDEDDMETFITSEQIVEEKKKLSERGIETTPKVEHEDVCFKRYSRRHEHKYTDKEMEEIRQGCIGTIVHDYSEHDIYHESDEERAKNDALAEISLRLSKVKSVYRKIDQYIEAMRTVVEAWELLEKNNYLHTKEEFFQMVSDGRIYSNRIIMPKMKNLDKYNIDVIIKYISNPELDPKDLLPKDTVEDNWYDDTEEDEEATMARLLGTEEVEYVLANIDNPPKLKVKDIPRKFLKDYNRRGYMRRFKKNDKFSKGEKVFNEELRLILKKIEDNPMNGVGYTASYRITNNMFGENDNEIHDNGSFMDDIRFNGSWADDDAVWLYNFALHQKLRDQPVSNLRFNSTTYADEELKEFFNVLEQNGVDVLELRRLMAMTSEQTNAKEVKNQAKKNRKVEDKMLRRLLALNDNPKFKKLAAKAEQKINDYKEHGDDDD